MEWSVGEKKSRFKISLGKKEDVVVPTSISIDGIEKEAPDFSLKAGDGEGQLIVELEGRREIAHVANSGDDWWIHFNGRTHLVRLHEKGGISRKEEGGGLEAPMPGTVIQILVKEGQKVREGQTLLLLEAMKMEHKVTAARNGVIKSLNFSVGDRVEMGSILAEISD